MRGGGAERVMSLLANAWAAQRRTVTLFTLEGPHAPHYQLDPRIQVRHLDISGNSSSRTEALINNARRLRQLRRALLNCAADVTLSFIDKTNVLVCTALLGTKVPLVVSDRIYPSPDSIPPLWLNARRVSYFRANSIVLQTEDVRETLPKELHPRIRVIANPIDARICQQPLAKDRKRFVAIGRLTHQKGFDILLRAYAQLAGAERWPLDIFGIGPDERKLKQLASELRIDQDVHFHGLSHAIPEELAKGGVFVLPSRFEGFPNALLEAMGAGLPCIATRCKSGPETLIAHNTNGLLVPTENVDALTAALRALAGDATHRRQLAKQAASVRETYSLDTIVAQWELALRAAGR